MTFAVLAFALGSALRPSLAVRDVTGMERYPLQPAPGKAAALFFVTNDCPISNYYAREIHRICDDYALRGLACSLVYTDEALTDEQARAHAAQYGHGAYPWIVDRQHLLVKATGATVTPEVAVVTDEGKLAYRGRIDDFFVTWGQSRRQVKQHDLRDALDAVFAGKPVAEPETKAIGCWIP